MFEALYVAKVGIAAGLIMGMAAMILGMIKFTNLDLTKYMGGLLTGKPSGVVNFVAGFSFHIFVSIILAFVYLFFITNLHISITLQNGIHAGLIHTLISGMLVHILDRFNPCVTQGSIKGLGYFASNYGITATITFTAGHIIYAIIVFMFLAQ